MLDIHRSRGFAAAIATVGLLAPVAAGAASSVELGVHIVKLQHVVDSTRGPRGRAFIALDRTFALPGVCVYSGGVNAPSGWKLEFIAEDPSFNSMWALAMIAYSSGRSVDVYFDDGFGAGTTCRVTSIVIGD